MSEESANEKMPDISEILGNLLSNQDLMSKLSNITGSDKGNDIPSSESSMQTPNIDSLLSDPNIISKLPEVINVIKPLVTSSPSKSEHSAPSDKRLGLLMSMKPYLNPRRCEAIDYIVKMSKITETIKGLKL